MTRPEIEIALAAAIDAESLIGIRWWPGREMAPIVFRRWTSFERRWRGSRRRHKTKIPSFEDRALDLAKGLQAHFDPQIPNTELGEFLHLARILAKVFEGFS